MSIFLLHVLKNSSEMLILVPFCAPHYALMTIFHCPGTYYNHFLFLFLRFEQAFITSLISSVVKTKGSYFWIALQDQNGTGEYTWKTAEGQKSEPVQYTHWNAYQPRK